MPSETEDIFLLSHQPPFSALFPVYWDNILFQISLLCCKDTVKNSSDPFPSQRKKSALRGREQKVSSRLASCQKWTRGLPGSKPFLLMDALLWCPIQKGPRGSFCQYWFDKTLIIYDNIKWKSIRRKSRTKKIKEIIQQGNYLFTVSVWYLPQFFPPTV